MSNDSGFFRTRQQLEERGWRLYGNIFCQDESRYLPLYEAKMFHHFTHRFGDYADYPEDALTTQLPDVPLERLQNPHYVVQPRYWIPENAVEERLHDKWNQQWFLGWRDICRSTDERTVITSVLPKVGVGNKIPLMLINFSACEAACLQANLSTFCYDYASRQKIGGTTLNFFIYKQLPVLPPSAYAETCLWSPAQTRQEWLVPRVLELTYTAYDLKGFAEDCGCEGEPFCWDEERRFLLRCELDAAYFHLYSITRDDVDYIMETFPIVKRKNEAQFGEYRTKRVILEVYDAMQRAITTGEPYHTRLDPPPADPRVAHQTEAIST
jgi:hypothetical protein